MYCFQRRGVVSGVDYGATGEVKKIDVLRIHETLDSDCIAIVSNLGYSSSGEVLNCKYLSNFNSLFIYIVVVYDQFVE